MSNENLWYQQDGAPPHYAADVRSYFDQVFANRIIGSRGTIEDLPQDLPTLLQHIFFFGDK